MTIITHESYLQYYIAFTPNFPRPRLSRATRTRRLMTSDAKFLRTALIISLTSRE